MKARTLIIATAIGLWMAPLGIAAGVGSASDEEARLIARLNWQRTRIEALQAEIRSLAQVAPGPAVPGDEALRRVSTLLAGRVHDALFERLMP